jgi:hypothetical protein
VHLFPEFSIKKSSNDLRQNAADTVLHLRITLDFSGVKVWGFPPRLHSTTLGLRRQVSPENHLKQQYARLYGSSPAMSTRCIFFPTG